MKMNITKKIVVAVIWFTWVAVSTFWVFAASTPHSKWHHKHHQYATDFWSWKALKLLPLNLDNSATQINVTDLKKTEKKSEKKWKKVKWWSWENLEFHVWALWFLWNFLDDSQLTENQKAEIQLLQADKQKKMAELHEKMITASEDEKPDLASEMKKVNSDFLNALKKYISEEKAEEYNEFLNELPDWDKKAEKKKGEKVEKIEKVAQN